MGDPNVAAVLMIGFIAHCVLVYLVVKMLSTGEPMFKRREHGDQHK